MNRSVLLGALMSVLSSSCGAIPMAEFKRLMDNDRQAAQHLVRGIAAAFVLVNRTNRTSGQPLLYCRPATIPLLPEQYMTFLEAEIKKGGPGTDDEGTVEGALLLVMRRTFPCPAGG